jgi:hypothetical protein
VTKTPNLTFIKQFLTAPFFLLIANTIWLLLSVSSQLRQPGYLNDSAMHEEMVRFAAQRIENGHFPNASWFPYLNLGSPHFLHYQALGANLAGIIGTFINPITVFSFSTYLCLSFFPIVIYLSMRILQFDKLTSAFAAICSDFISSVPAIGYEQKAYIWVGYGLWAQLLASMFMPIAISLIFRALEDRRYFLSAAISSALTICLHFESGYFPLAALVIFPFLEFKDLFKRLFNAAILFAIIMAMTLWEIGPLLLYSKWAAVNELLSSTPLVNGYGAKQVLTWLVDGKAFDYLRFPIITILAAIGFISCVINIKTNRYVRPIVALFIGSLLIEFGPKTWGALVDIIPGHTDIFFRRFQMGEDLAAIYFSAIGLRVLFDILKFLAKKLASALQLGEASITVRKLSQILGLLFLVLVLYPGWSYIRNLDGYNAAYIDNQISQESIFQSYIYPIIAYVKAHPTGRTYAGSPTNWGNNFLAGQIQVYKLLANYDVDEVGFTLRTASLMSGPEAYFNEDEYGDYKLFGISYILCPRNMTPPVKSTEIMAKGPYKLMKVPDSGYFSVMNLIGTIGENRKTVTPISPQILSSPMLNDQADYAVIWDSNQKSEITANSNPSLSYSVLEERPDLFNGQGFIKVRLKSTATVILSASYDPGWQVYVDNKKVPTVIVAPAVVGVNVSKGTHNIQFVYVGYQYYWILFILCSLGIVSALVLTIISFTKQRP